MNITNAKRTEFLSIEEYHSVELGALTASAIKQADRSMAHLKAWLDGERPSQTPAMAFGEAVHMYVLEPERFASTYVVEEEGVNRRIKAYKEWKQEQLDSGNKILSFDDMNKITAIGDSLIGHPTAGKLFEPGRGKLVECSWFGEYGRTLIATRPDAVYLDDRLIVDLKTATDASYRGFQSALGKFRYDIQAALAIDLISSVEGGKPKDWVFAFCVVEKEPPYAAAVYVLDALSIDAGRMTYQHVAKRVAECRESGEWPGYDTEVQTITLPAWALEVA